MGLRIALRDGERVVVNGAVLRAAGRTEIFVENKATILRSREVMQPEEATTPATQLYFHTMMAYIDEDGREEHQERIIQALQAVTALLPSDAARTAALAFARNAAHQNFYKALGDCRTLVRIEADALAQAGAKAA